ncbi:hypothetical protein QRX60_43075 [Amycolatopsis mongoliensis]|uniref:Uncharacterized protein n=1 Tax=Amycolatopsis mongoliensis TaxID=715475 RepID=A0A9Y2JLL1_9PSEU|nr:hypothetical protein [Amycolatopsis sp. 4-36]WIY00770.1 hypothetical protein QRX60_43075 [Amycolatopsis sp. 4-36]
MAGTERVLRYVAFGVLMAFAAFGALFIVGETMLDPGGAPGVLLTLSWSVPMAVLTFCAARWPRAAAGVLTVVAVAVALFVVADALFGFRAGPAAFIAGFAVAVPLGVLGLRRPVRAGWLLLAVGTLLTASGAVTVGIPVLVGGGIFLLAAASGRPRG